MAKRCTRCGNFLMDDERFCTRCGENVSSVMPENAAPAVSAPQDNAFGRNDGYVSPTAVPPAAPAQNYNQPYTYAQPTYNAAQEEMSLGKWVGTIIVTTFFGLISLIFLFVWGFGDGPDARKKYCKAMLIVDAISIGIAILLYIALFAVIAGSMGSLADEFRSAYREYGQTAAVTLATFLGK